jgi:hypothetical protein
MDLLGRWAIHVDQVSMFLALVNSNIPLHPLDISWNCPTHLKRPLPQIATVHALHYHRAVDADGRLRCTNSDVVNEAIERVNAAFDDVRRDAAISA